MRAKIRIARRHLCTLAVALFAAALSASAVAVQGPTGTGNTLSAAVRWTQSTQTYVQSISQNVTSAWNAAANTLSAQPAPPTVIGQGMANLPSQTKIAVTGTRQQTVVYNLGPLNIPVTTTDKTIAATGTDGRAYTGYAATDPLSAINLNVSGLVPQNAVGVETGYAWMANSLVSTFRGTSGSGDGGAWRIDPGLAYALNTNLAEGAGKIFGVGAYLTGALGNAGAREGHNLDGGNANPLTDLTTNPILPLPEVQKPSAKIPPAPNEEVTLKAVIPQPEPQFSLEFAPNFPTVVGQDPNQRGVDVTGTAILGPCTVIWHHKLTLYYYVSVGKDENGEDIVEERVEIREWDTTEYEPDAMASASINSALNPKSVAYIQGELARIYPGARVYQGSLQSFPNGRARVTRHDVGIPTIWQFRSEKLPYADPRTWDYTANLMTTGTPHCGPLNWSKTFPDILRVYLREERLVK